jgi:hypothetical protein
MKVINISKLGTVIWDKSLDYPKLLKQVVDLETLVESKNTMISQLSSTISNREANNTDLHNKNTKLYEDNQNLYSQIKRKTNAFYCLGLVLGLNIVYILIH